MSDPDHPWLGLVSARRPQPSVTGVSKRRGHGEKGPQKLVNGADLVVAALLVELELDDAFLGRVLEQLVEVAVTVVSLVEAGIHALQSRLDETAPAGVVVGLERRDRRDEAVERLLLAILALVGALFLRLLARLRPLLHAD